jgi:hypothetical protein
MHTIEVSADIVSRVVEIAKTLLIPSYRYVFDETSGSSSENIKIWITEHILIKSLEYDTITLRDLKRSVSSNTYRYDGISNVLAISTTRLTISAETSIVCGCSIFKAIKC